MEDPLLSESTIPIDLDLPFDGSNNEEHVFDINLEKDKENEEIIAAEKKTEDDLKIEMALTTEKNEALQENVQDKKIKSEKSRKNKRKHKDIKYYNLQLKIHKHIVQSLEKIVSLRGTTREKELNVLFNNLASLVSVKIKESFLCKQDYYYEIVAQFYLDHPERAFEIMQLGKDHFWDNYQFAAITSLVFYLWVFDNSQTMKEVLIFVKGCFKLFTLDVENLTTAFRPIHEFLRSQILMNGIWLAPNIVLYLLEIFNLCSGFYFYYSLCSTESLQIFITETERILLRNNVQGPIGHIKIHVLNMFVNEVIRHIRLLRQESVIVTYLKACQLFVNTLDIPGRKTRLRLHTLLLDENTPGGPLYPTRPIRDAAKEALDIIFPAGKYSRWLVNKGFRILHPLELTRSWYYWISSWVSLVLLFFYNLYQSIMRKLGLR
jgi:hypothetical protein